MILVGGISYKHFEKNKGTSLSQLLPSQVTVISAVKIEDEDYSEMEELHFFHKYPIPQVSIRSILSRLVKREDAKMFVREKMHIPSPIPKLLKIPSGSSVVMAHLLPIIKSKETANDKCVIWSTIFSAEDKKTEYWETSDSMDVGMFLIAFFSNKNLLQRGQTIVYSAQLQHGIKLIKGSAFVEDREIMQFTKLLAFDI